MNIQQEIETRLRDSFQPEHMAVENESHQHSVPANSETHFKVILVSTHFTGVAKVKRHQQIYHLLAEQMNQGVHALALHLYSPEEWQARGQLSPDSPQCLGGSKSETALE